MTGKKLTDKYALSLGTMLWLLPVLLIYVLTMSHSVGPIDSGELAAVQVSAGIAHPTGYPLYMFTGYLWSLIPLPLSPIVQLNLFALMCTFSGVYFAAQAIGNLLRFTHKKILYQLMPVACFIGAFGFSSLVWNQSSNVEVYSFQILIWGILLYYLVKSMHSPNAWMGVSAALAASFGNHMTALVFLPGILLLFIQSNGINKKSFPLILKCVGIFLSIIILLYGLLVIRAASDPQLNWGNPSNWDRLYRHVSGAQYSVWMFSKKAFQRNFPAFWNLLLSDFHILLIPGIIGVYQLFTKSRNWFYFSIITFFFTAFYVSYYDIKDLQPYYLASWFMMALWIASGAIFIAEKSKNKLPVLAALSVTPFISMPLHYSDCDHSKEYLYSDYTQKALASVPDSSVIIGYQWDIFISPALYYTVVENVRPDVLIIDKELMRRSWYYNQLEKFRPNLFKYSESQKAEFLKALVPFEQGTKFDGNFIQQKFTTLISTLIININKRYPVYIAPEILEKDLGKDVILTENMHLHPQNYFFRLNSDTSYMPAELFQKEDIRFRNKQEPLELLMKDLRAKMLLSRAMYELQHGFKERARTYIDEIKTVYPDFKRKSELDAFL